MRTSSSRGSRIAARTGPLPVLAAVCLLAALLACSTARAQNRPAGPADLAITLSHLAEFELFQEEEIVVTVTNLGPGVFQDGITVTMTLPAGLVFADQGSRGGWKVDASAAPLIIATMGGALPPGRSGSSLSLVVIPDGSVLGDVPLVAGMDAGPDDPQPANDTAFSIVRIVEPRAVLSAVKSLATVADPINGDIDPKAIPGAMMEYSVEVANGGEARIDRDTIVFTDRIPAGTSLSVAPLPGAPGPVAFTDGAVASGLSVWFESLGSAADDVEFSADGGLSWTYVPVPDAEGCDGAVTHVRVRPEGRMKPRRPAGPASFVLSFRVRVQ